MSLFEDFLATAEAEFNETAAPGPADATELGVDIACTDDIPAGFPLVSGYTTLAQSIYRRLTSPRGSVIDAPDYGLDVREYLSRGLTQAQLAAMPGEIRAEVLKDERVHDCSVTVVSSTDTVLELAFSVQAEDGPFTFTVSVSEAGATLNGGA